MEGSGSYEIPLADVSAGLQWRQSKDALCGSVYDRRGSLIPSGWGVERWEGGGGEVGR